MSRQIYAVCLKCLFSLVLLLGFGLPALGQSSDRAGVTGIVQDTTDARIPNASVKLINADTGTESNSKTNKDGNFVIPGVLPGHYTLQIERDGFDTTQLTGITLNVGDNKNVVIRMKVGSKNETVTVDGSGSLINTTDASVSTVIDRKFVENTPLNGRSFQSLILLTPGTVTNSPQTSSSPGYSGEFSVNGQRTESNYYMVDGVSANAGVSTAVNGGATSGSLPASTALGTTQALVSVDALQEFRVEGSTYSAEYGRNPGGQFSMVTRSGTNDWHGTIFDYFRNDVLDANNWFDDNTVPITRKSAERQNDFGGTFGGPVQIPHLYNGKNKTFVFFSYEGLRLVQPQGASINAVPDTGLRQSANGVMQQVLNAFPLPTQGASDLGSGIGEFISGWSNPSQVDATSIRVDHTIRQRTHLFFRFSDTPSSSQTRGTSIAGSTPSTVTSSRYLSHTYTFGTTTTLTRAIVNDLRLNYSLTRSNAKTSNDNFGGAVPVDLSQLQGVPDNSAVTIALYLGAYYPSLSRGPFSAIQKQWNLVDTVNIEHGRHQLKLGIDWRRLTPSLPQPTPQAEYIFLSPTSVTNNSVDEGFGQSYRGAYPIYLNFSLFAQDEWRVVPRLTLSMGVRWDVNPAPGVSQGSSPYTVAGLNDFSTMTLAPQGSKLWNTGWYNFAPRLGVAYTLNSVAGKETVLRGGGGLFFDTGQQNGSYGFDGIGFQATNYFGTYFGVPTSFPAPISTVAPSIPTVQIPQYGPVFASSQHLQLPYTIQWNASLEQALGRSQSLTISYVGANGRKLLEETYYSLSGVNPDFSSLYLFKNGLTSSYNALQIKFQRQLFHGFQALGSYTWSHALDYGSYNAALPYQHGNSSQDVRNNATAAISYDAPHAGGSSLLHVLSSDWGIDGRFTARSGFPVTLNGNYVTDPVTGEQYYGGLNLIPNVPLYLYGSSTRYPGGRSINPAAFVLPATGQYGNAPRNFVNGFGVVQTDVAIRRTFPIHDAFRGQFRAEAFNVFNHPMFGMIDPYFGQSQFGQATAILSQSLGTLSPLYQMGGPRSLQLSLKLTF